MPPVHNFHDFTLNPRSRTLLWRGQPLSLTAKQFDLLLALVERAGRPVDKQELRDLVWPDVHVEENNLTQHIFQLRKALASVAGDNTFIETLPKTGYQFVAPVTTTLASRRRIPVWVWATAALAAEVAAGIGRMDGLQVQVVQPLSTTQSGDFNLTGSLTQNTLTAELRRSNGDLLWRREWTDSPAELTAELIAQTAITLEQQAGARRRALAGRKPPANQEAYSAYLDGLQHLLARKSTESRPAIEAFQRALRADPAFSSAYTGMALAFAWQGINQAEDPKLVWPRARELSQRAIALDPDNGEARMVQAMVLAYADQNEAEAERLVRTVLSSDPSSVHLQLLAGQLLSRFGHFREAESILKRAIYADPTFILSRQMLAFHYYQSRQFDLSKREAWRLIRANPRSATGYGLLVPPLWMTGDWRTAAWIARRAESSGLNQPMVAMGLAYTYGRSGNTEDARRIVLAMDDQARLMYVSPYQRAVAHMGLGHTDEAVKLLRACLASGCVNPSALRLEPVFDPLRQRADFSTIAR